MAGIDPLGLKGLLLEGHVTVERALSETPLAVTYRAVYRGLGEPVSLKAFRLPPNLSPERVKSFMDALAREASDLQSLVGAGGDVPPFVAFGSATVGATVVPYLVTEWLDGQSLAAELELRTSAVPLAEVAHWVHDAAQVLEMAHARGLTHRDLCSTTLFVEKPAKLPPRLRIVDFGVSSLLEAWGGELASPFEPKNAAPEQLDGSLGEVGPPADVFALALVMLEALLPRLKRKTGPLAHRKKRSHDPQDRPTPKRLGLALAPKLTDVLDRALAVRPTDRFGSAAALYSALAEADLVFAAAARAPGAGRPSVPLTTVRKPPLQDGQPTERAPMAMRESSVVSVPSSEPETERFEPSTVRIGGASVPPPPLRRSSAPALGPPAPHPFTFAPRVVPSVEVPQAADPTKHVDLSATLPVASPRMSTLLSVSGPEQGPPEPETSRMPDGPTAAVEPPRDVAGPILEATAVDRLPPEPVEPAPAFQRTAVMAVAVLPKVAPVVAPAEVPPVVMPMVAPVEVPPAVMPMVAPAEVPPLVMPMSQPVETPYVPAVPAPASVRVETPVMAGVQIHQAATPARAPSQPERATFEDDEPPKPPMESSRTFVLAGMGAVALIAVLGLVLALRGSSPKTTAVVPSPPVASLSPKHVASAPSVVPSPPPEVAASGALSASKPSPAIERAFDTAAAQATLDSVPGTQSECRKLNGPRGKWKATVTFEPTGKVSDVELEKPFNRTPSGKCVKDHLKLAEIAPFGGPAQKVTTVVPIFLAGK
jgi:serine/threonine protein kinase